MQAATKVTERAATAASGSPVTILAFTGDIASTSKDAIMDAYNGLGASASKRSSAGLHRRRLHQLLRHRDHHPDAARSQQIRRVAPSASSA